MSHVHLYVGPPLSGKTRTLISRLEEFAPFNYIFIGSQGEFVKNIAKIASSKLGSVNRDAFKTIDQVAVEAVSKQKGLLFVDKTLKLSILSQIVEDMASKNLDVPEELTRQASMIRRRSTIEKLLSFIDDVKTYMKEKEFQNPEDRRDIFMSVIMEKLQDYYEINGLFDTYDAYKMVADGEVKIKGKALFVDGFYDFTPVVSAFFKRLFSDFEKVYITVTTGSVFEKGSSTILKTVEEFHPIVEKMEFKGSMLAKGLFFGEGEGLKIYSFEKRRDEVKWVCAKVKESLLKGGKPGNVEIVVKSSESPYVKALQEKFEEYGVKASYLAKKKLSQNVAVQQLMLPLRVITNGYRPDHLSSMIMIGFAGEEDNFNLVYDSARLFRGPLRLSHQARLKNWLKRLENYLKYLSKKKEFIEKNDDEYDKSASLEEIRRMTILTRKAVHTVKRLFEFLEKFEKARDVSKYTEVFEEAIQILRKRGLNDEDEKAVETFEELLWQIEGVWNFLEKRRLSVNEYRFYLELQIKDKFYTPSEDERIIRISDVLTSRFTSKPLKIFVGFNEGVYPSFHQNYFYTSLEEERHFGQNRFLKSLNDERIDLYVALAKAKESYLTFPTANDSGVRMLPSLYSSELREKFKIDFEIPLSFPPMSVHEAVLAYSKWARENERKKDVEETLGISLDEQKSYKVGKDKELEKLAKMPVSFYRFKTYKECPLRFFFAYVLKLPQRFAYTFDLNALEVGNVYHNVMKNVLQNYTRDELKRKSEESLYSLLKEFVKDELLKTTFLEEPLLNVELLRLSSVLLSYLKGVELVDADSVGKGKNLFKYLAYKGKKKEYESFVPCDFEHSLDGKRSEIDGVNFRGRIDRIDKCSSGIMVVDYKTKLVNRKEYSPQLYIYSKIAEDMFNMPVLCAAFAMIEKRKVTIVNSKEIKENLPQVMKDIKAFLEGVKIGSFKPTKEKCSRCDYETLCPEAK